MPSTIVGSKLIPEYSGHKDGRCEVLQAKKITSFYETNAFYYEDEPERGTFKVRTTTRTFGGGFAKLIETQNDLMYAVYAEITGHDGDYEVNTPDTDFRRNARSKGKIVLDSRDNARDANFPLHFDVEVSWEDKIIHEDDEGNEWIEWRPVSFKVRMEIPEGEEDVELSEKIPYADTEKMALDMLGELDLEKIDYNRAARIYLETHYGGKPSEAYREKKKDMPDDDSGSGNSYIQLESQCMFCPPEGWYEYGFRVSRRVGGPEDSPNFLLVESAKFVPRYSTYIKIFVPQEEDLKPGEEFDPSKLRPVDVEFVKCAPGVSVDIEAPKDFGDLIIMQEIGPYSPGGQHTYDQYFERVGKFEGANEGFVLA